MNVSQQLAIERRQRLEAERLLKQRESELRKANSRLAKHSVTLSVELDETRAATSAVTEKAKALESSYSQAQSDLARANEAIKEAEKTLWAALQTVRDGFALFDDQLRLVIANRAYLSIFDGLEDMRPGIQFEDIARLMLEEGIVDPEGDPDVWLERITGRLHQDPIPDMVFRIWNGQFVRLVDRRTPDGGVVSLGINQTEMMRMWAAIETVPDGFVLYDQDDRLIMSNQRYREIYPESAEAIVPGASFEDILRFGLTNGQYADAVGREEAWLEERLNDHRSPEPKVLEQRLGDGRWLRILEGPTPDGGRVGLRVDITALKEHQAELERERERAEAANRAKSAFLANMSHEIRTPMNGVVGMADLLQESMLNDDQQLYVNTIKSSGEALLVILNDILDYSKIEAGRMALHPAPFDLEQLLHDIVILMQPKAREKSLDLIVDFDMFLPTEFEADSGRLKQIVTNLVGNAVKFTASGHVLIRVLGMLDEETPGLYLVTVTIEDTGIGIAPDKLDHVFGKFNQVEEEQNRTFEGTGLGLAITRELVEAMGGSIWVDSEVGVGSSFGFALPLPIAGGSVSEIPTDPPPGLTRALVIETAGEAREVLLKQLATLGLRTEVFEPGQTPPTDGLGPEVAALVAGGPDAERWIAALQKAGVARILLVNRSTRPATPPEGIEAVLTHPIRRALLGTVLRRAEETSKAPQTPEVAEPAAQSQLRILAAEDNRTNRLVFERLVASLDVDLTFACNGVEAVEKFEDFDPPPDMIFMDISMPEMDGKEATRRIRDIEAMRGLPHTPIVAMTAHALSGDEEEILGAGLDDYLTKPLGKAKIAERVDMVRSGQFRARKTQNAAE